MNNDPSKTTGLSVQNWKSLYKFTQRLFVVFAVFFACSLIWNSRSSIYQITQKANSAYLFISVCFYITLHLTSVAFSIVILNDSQVSIRYWDAFKIYATNLPARYIPGGIWHTLGRAKDFHTQGISPTKLVTFFLFENILSGGLTLFLGGMSVWYFGANVNWSYVAALCILGGFFLLLIPSIKLPFRFLAQFQFLNGKKYTVAISILVIFWCIAGTSFFLYISAFNALNSSLPFINTIGSYMLAWGIGLISFFSPQGIGVTELVLANVLPIGISFEQSMLLMAGFRIIIFIADMCTWVLAILITYQTSKCANIP